ncbi:MAG: FISUMP domain-containing protein [Bacteroidales bacterium]
MTKLPCTSALRLAFILFIGFSFIPAFITAQDKGTFKDSRDGHSYNWVKIGTQVWMTENLRVKLPSGSWAYNDDTVTEAAFGRLFSWKSAQTACPKGWHLPSDKEWATVVQALGGSKVAGEKVLLLDTIGKTSVPFGSGRPVLPSTLLSGVRHPDGSCIGLNFWGGCWTSGKVNDSVGNNMLFVHGSKEMGESSNDKNSGFSVRCIKSK